MDPEFFTTENGKMSLKHKNFIFYKDKTLKDKTYWKCSEFEQQFCKARVYAHLINQINLAKRQFLNDLKTKTVTSTESFHALIAISSVDLTPALAARIP